MSINLLPWREINKKATVKKSMIISAIMLLGVLVIAMTLRYLLIKKMAQLPNTNQDTALLTSNQNIKEKIKTIEINTKKLQHIIMTKNNANNHLIRIKKILIILAKQIPNQITLLKIQINHNKIIINGTSTNQIFTQKYIDAISKKLKTIKPVLTQMHWHTTQHLLFTLELE